MVDCFTVLNTKALKKDISNTTNGQIIFTKYTGIGKGGARNAPIRIDAPCDSNPTAKAAITFNNVGINCHVLWLDEKGFLRLTNDATGESKIIAFE